MAGIFPKAPGLKEYWRLVRWSEDAVGEVPASHWRVDDYFDADPKSTDKTYCRRGAFLSAVDFDPTEFGIPPAALEATDTAQLLGLLVAKDALIDAGYWSETDDANARAFDRARTSVILGVTGTLELVIPLGARLGHPHWRRALIEAGVDTATAEDVIRRISDSYVGWQENSFPGLLGNVVAGRIANRLDLRGTNCVVDAACASSLSAMHLAALELSAGRSDMVVTGGVDTLNDIFMYMCFSKTQALSAAGNARPFAADADGTVIGEGVGMLIFKRLADAERDGDRIYAVLRGMGTSSDGKSQSIYAPRAAGQAEALRNAYAAAGVSPRSIGLIEAHGTGTKVGDLVEFEALASVYRQAQASGTWCGVGSVKSQVGHTKAAAGAASIIKAALALHHRTLPATIKIDKPNPKMAIADSPFYVSTRTRPWFAEDATPRRAGVSSFGFGGSNFHAVLEEAPRTTYAPAWDGSVEIVPLAGADVHELLAQVEAWRRAAENGWKDDPLAARAHAARQAFAANAAHRVVVVLEHGVDAAPVFGRVADALRRGPDAATWKVPDAYYGGPSAPGKLAFLFPGQASQYVGMGGDVVCHFPEAHAALAEANDDDLRLTDAIYPMPSFDADLQARQRAQLTQTELAQPALGAVSLALWRVLARFGVRADAVAGHSYGELPALRAAGWIDDDTLRRLSRERGRVMADGSGDRGTMAAVSAPLPELERWLADAGPDVVLANRNSPNQGVISGPTDAVQRAAAACRQRGWRATELNVSGAFHSRLMAAAHKAFAETLGWANIKPQAVDVFANVTGTAYPQDAKKARTLLAEQLLSPVRFVELVENLYAADVRTFVEVGPKQVLCGLVQRILNGRGHRTIALDASGGKRSGVADLARALAQLAAAGHDVKLSAWEEQPRPRRKPKMVVPLLGANYRNNKKSVAAPPKPARAVTQSVSAGGQPPANQPMETKMNAKPSGPSLPATATPNPSTADAPAPITPLNTTTFNASANPGALGDIFQTVQEGLRAMQALQQQTATAHQRFLEGQEQAQRTFQMVMESQHRLFERVAGLPSTPEHVRTSESVNAGRSGGVPGTMGGTPTGLAALNTPQVIPAQPAVLQQPGPSVPAAPAASDEWSAGQPQPAAADSPSPAESPIASASSSAAAGGFEATMLAVVAELTGYPVEMLDVAMDMEADLGIDSIKRVEILAAMQEKLPGLKAVASAHMGSLRTLQDIIEYMGGSAHATPAVADPPSLQDPDAAPIPTATSAPTTPPTGGDFQTVLLAVVAELTGYPEEMLDAEMDMEADLGIDSIKRVEILAAVQERMPGLKPVESGHMGSLRTLRDIMAYMGEAVEPEAAQTVNPKMGSALPASIPVPQEPASTPSARDTAPTDAIHDAAATATATAPAPLRRQVLTATDLPAVSEGILSIAPGHEVWVVDDGTGLADAIVARLVEDGIAARAVGVTAPVEGEACAPVGGLVLLFPPADAPHLDTTDQLKAAFALTQELAEDLQSAAASGGALFVTVSRMDGAFGLSGGDFDPVQGGLAGLAKTVAHEWPRVRCKALDVSNAWDDVPAIADMVLAELRVDGPVEVGLASGRRCGLELVERPVAPQASRLEPGDVVLVSGGARGVTAETVAALAAAHRPRLILLGRSPAPAPEPDWARGVTNAADLKRGLLKHEFAGRKPSPSEVEAAFRRLTAGREISDTLARIKAVGATAEYRSVDVCDRDGLRALVRDLRERYGAVRGLVHGAGVIEDRLIVDKDMARFERVFDTKVAGIQALLDAVGTEDLKCLILFSSVSGRFGRQGQVDYAMANEVLNKLAQRLAVRRPHCRVVSINWGPWDGGMVTEPLKREFQRLGIALIPLAAGAQALVDELVEGDRTAVEVLIGGAFPAAQAGVSPPVERKAGKSESAKNDPVNDTLTAVLTRRLDVASHVFLADHVIGGKPVLPVAVMLEWLAHGALHDHPGLVLAGVDDLRVLKGVIVDGGAVDIEVAAGRAVRENQQFRVPVELRSRAGDGRLTLHARATAVLASRLVDAPKHAPRNDLATEPYTKGAAGAYREVLFHGPMFHAITDVAGVSAAGVAAQVSTDAAPGAWMTHPPRSNWLTAPLALDAALQLGIVWCAERLGAPSLPSFGGCYRQYRTFDGDGVRCELAVREATDHRLRADVTLLDARGAVVATWQDVTWTVDASLAAAFGRQSAAQARR